MQEFIAKHREEIARVLSDAETDASPFWTPFELGRAYEQKTMFKEAVAELSKAVAHYLNASWTHAFGDLIRRAER